MRRRSHSGENLVVDDRTGFVHRASDMRREWNGAIVHRSKWEARHPQDFIRARKEDIAVKDARSRPTDKYHGPLITEVTQACAAGQRTLYVLNTERMQVGDSIAVMLDNTDMHRTAVEQILSGTSLFLTSALPSSTSSGLRVINYTAVSPSDLG